MARVFIYDGMEFRNLGSNLKVNEIDQHMANFFQELSNVETKQSGDGADDTIKFKRRIETRKELGQEKFDIIEGILASVGEIDSRETAMILLSAGIEAGQLEESVGIIQRRFGLTPKAVLQWYIQKLDMMIEECKVQLEQLGKVHLQIG